MPYRTSAKTDLDALAIDLAPKPPTRAQRLRHAGLVAGLTVVTLLLTGWLTTFVDKHTKVIGATTSTRPRFEPPRTAKVTLGDEVGEPPDSAQWEFDPFSGDAHFRRLFYEDEAGTYRPIAPVEGLRIDDASSENIMISRRDMRRGAAANAGRIHDCFRAHLGVSPRAPLALRVKFLVLPSGATTDADVIDEGTGPMGRASPRLLQCLTRNFSNLFYRNIGATQRAIYLLRFTPP